MENASKALIIAGAILLSILIIAIGMAIYSSSQSAINDSLTDFSTQQVEGFNSNFTSYIGKSTGSNVSNMLTRLIANANTYADEPTKIPCVQVDQINAGKTAVKTPVEPATGGAEKGQQDYIDALTAMKNKVENKHTYYVTMSYQANGLIDYISIGYDKEMAKSETTHRKTK